MAISADQAYALYTQARQAAGTQPGGALTFGANGVATQDSIARSNAFQAEAGNRALAQAGYKMDQFGNVVPAGAAASVSNNVSQSGRSIALDWALANGLSQAEFDRRIFNTVRDANAAGASNALMRIEMDRLGISAEDVARATGVSIQSVVDKYNAATPTTEAELIANAAADAELAARTGRDTTASQSLIDARNLDARTSAGALTADQLAKARTAEQALITKQNEAALALQQNNAAYAEQQRLNNLAYAEQQRLNNLASAEQQRLNKIKSDQQIADNEKAYQAYLANQAKLAGQQGGTGTGTGTGLLATTGATSVTGTTPFANATQGFEQNFRNYTSIPIGAQYNPNVVGGTGSPYAQVMGQMKPVGNPYAGVVAGQAMGGYNPGLYDQIAAANVAKTAAETAATTAATQTGLEQSSTGGMAKGGMVDGGLMFGMNPPGPDDGAVNLDMGEYVIKKSSVNKYGR